MLYILCFLGGLTPGVCLSAKSKAMNNWANTLVDKIEKTIKTQTRVDIFKKNDIKIPKYLYKNSYLCSISPTGRPVLLKIVV